MSAFSGQQGRGAKANLRKVKRAEAEERNAKTDPTKRRQYRIIQATRRMQGS